MVLLYFSSLAAAGVHFSSLKNALRVTATIRGHNSSTKNVAKAGSDDVEVTWALEGSLPAGDRWRVQEGEGAEVSYGQTTNRNKTSNLLVVEPISGRHVSSDIATACFSVFSVVALLGFFVAEKMGANKAQKK
eukprot:Gb_07110 [translate_table: standard]